VNLAALVVGWKRQAQPPVTPRERIEQAWEIASLIEPAPRGSIRRSIWYSLGHQDRGFLISRGTQEVLAPNL
jgi:hypothetical protein